MTGTQAILSITLLPPLATALLSWTGLKLLTPREAAPGETVANTVPEIASGPAPAPVTEPLYIAAWSAVTPFGDADATVASSREQIKAFKPDSAIRNDDGSPVHAATVKELPLELLDYPPDTRSRAARVTAMLVPVLNALFSQQERMVGAVTSTTVFWLLPEEIPLDEGTRRGFSSAWSHSFWRHGKYDLHLLPATTTSAYGTLNSLAQNMNASRMPHALLLAADSLVNPDELLAPLALDQVFSNKSPDGFIPAEGAAGLLLVDATYGAASNLVGLCALGIAHQEQRVAERGGMGKVDSSALSRCMAAAVAAAGTPLDGVGMVVSDTDHRLPRSLEVIQAMEQTVPDLDPMSHRLTPMAYAGNFGAATDVIHLALAACSASTSGQPTLAVSVSHARNTAAAVIVTT